MDGAVVHRTPKMTLILFVTMFTLLPQTSEKRDHTFVKYVQILVTCNPLTTLSIRCTSFVTCTKFKIKAGTA